MDKAAIQQFSDTLREKLLSETQKRAALYGIHPEGIKEIDQEFEDSIVIAGKVFNKKIKKQREQLVHEIQEKGYNQVIDEVTYTWFNRFIALKYMEVNGYLPVMVFSSSQHGKTEPDLLTNVLNLDFLSLDREIVLDLKSKGKDEDLYKYLILHLCNYLHEKMPFLFEVLEDYSELLFPERFLHTDSILGDLNTIIAEEDWKEVEIIGWIYQDYITPRKTKIFADLKKNIKINKENIPAATQSFTPKWIVKYMVENSLGRLWLESNPNSEFRKKLKYYIETEEKVSEHKVMNPEEITIIDPAMGSGHILVYAFEVLWEIYKSRGYSEKEISTTILEKNLYGLEIDDRAGQLAGFALLMQARKKDRDILNKKIQLNLCSIQETAEENNISSEKYPNLYFLWNVFKNAKEYGSLLDVEKLDFDCITKEVASLKKDGSIDSFLIFTKVESLVKQAAILYKKYNCVITNPPYMGSGGMNPNVRNFVKENYPNSKSNLFAVFIEKCLKMTKKDGFTAMITMESWMFLESFDDLRYKILKNYDIDSMIHLGPKAFEQIGGNVVSTTSFVIRG